MYDKDKDIIEKRKKMEDAISNCMWRDTSHGEDNAICRGILLTCDLAILHGKCDTLIRMHKDGEI